jgi:hypothetical protein
MTQQNVGAVFNPRVWVGDPDSLRWLVGPAGQRQRHPCGLADGSRTARWGLLCGPARQTAGYRHGRLYHFSRPVVPWLVQ